MKYSKYIIVFLILGFSIALCLILIKKQNTEDALSEFKNSYPLLDKTRPLYKEQDLVVNLQPLRDYLKALPEQNKDWAEMSIYFEVLNTGSNITVNPDLHIWPASLSKLPVAMMAMKKVERGEWNLDTTPFVVAAEDADIKTNPDIVSAIGQTFSLRYILERLILESDNTAYNMIVKQLDPEVDLNSIPEAVGLDALVEQDGKMSAKNYTRLLRALYLATYLNPEHSNLLLNLMKDSDYKNFIRAGVPLETSFAHKWGTYLERNVFADSGIVYLENRPYMLSVMIQAKAGDPNENWEKANKLMIEIGQRSYDYMKTVNMP